MIEWVGGAAAYLAFALSCLISAQEGAPSAGGTVMMSVPMRKSLYSGTLFVIL